MIKDLLLIGSTVAPFFLVSPETAGLYLSGILLEKSLKDIHSQSSNQLNIATHLFRAIYSILGIASATFVGTLFNIEVMTSVLSIASGIAISLFADLAEYLCAPETASPKP